MATSYTENLISYARSFVGCPYIYAANGPDQFDCSGFVCFVLRKPGLIRLGEDLSAQALYEKFRATGTFVDLRALTFPAGTLLFYGKSAKTIDHVAIVSDWFSVIECGGGDSQTQTIEAARKAAAGVRERGVHLRGDVIAAVLPRYPWEGFVGN
jgi:hypothetical protein